MIHKKYWSLKNTSHTENHLTHLTKCELSEVWEQLATVTQWRRETSAILVKSWETKLLVLLLLLLLLLLCIFYHIKLVCAHCGKTIVLFRVNAYFCIVATQLVETPGRLADATQKLKLLMFSSFCSLHFLC